MRCPHCSAFLDRGSSRCWRCWLPIAPTDDAPSKGPRVSRAERRRALERAQHRTWRRRIILAGIALLAAGAVAFFVYDTIVTPDPRPDDDVAADILPTLSGLPADWSRGADSPDLAARALAECEAVLGQPFAEATDARAAVAFEFDQGASLVLVESFLLDGGDDTLAGEIVRAYGTGCVATRVAQRTVVGSALANPATERLELDARDATVAARRVDERGGGGDAWSVDVVAVAVDRGVVVFARASRGGVNGGVDTGELVALVAPRIADELSA